MKQFSLFLILLLFAFAVISAAQSSKNTTSKNSTVQPETKNLKTIQAAFNSYWENHEKDISKDGEEDEGSGYNQFRRWEWLMESRTFPSGNLPDPGIAARERANFFKVHPTDNTTRSASWTQVGTNIVPSNGGGAGRINVIRFDPVTPSTFYIGAAGGGIWKTTNGGNSWNPIGDQLPVTSIADIAIDPLNTQTLYAATGDGYGYEATWQVDSDFWGGVYTAGVLKSIDGGNSWQPTGLSYTQSNLQIVQRLLIHQTNPEILIAATRNGIYRTEDGGDTWTLVSPVHCYDMALNTSNSDIIYAAGNKDILQSVDAGATWTILKDNLGGDGRISIETTASDPNVIYALFESNTKLYKSSDGGITWVTKQSPSSATFYGYYDMAFTVSPFNSDILFAGGLEIVKSENGAQSWQVVSHWDSYPSPDYVHADNHALAFDPFDENIIYSGNDGGLFKSINLADSWTDLSNGLSISQIYRLSSSPIDPNVIYSGWQDNGTNRWDGTNWEQVYYADGMQPLTDYTDLNIVYACSQYGGLNKSTDGGNTFEYVSPSNGGWVTPYAMDPENHNVLYYGSTTIYKTTNGANSWSSVGNLFSSTCNAIAIAPSNTGYVYVASLDQMFRSTTGGSPWTNITAGLPVNQAGINYITVDNNDPENLWVAMSGYSDGNKVFHSTNGGASWTNVSGSLPNVPVNSIVYEYDSPGGLYIGTDIGVFYTDNTLSDWSAYMTGLPNVMVHHVEINYTSGKLLAATYGRGIWESDLYYAIQFANDIGTISISSPVNEVCSTSVDPVIKIKNYGTNTITSFNINYAVDGGSAIVYPWSGSLSPGSTITIALPAITGVSVGAHTFGVFTSDPNGNADDNGVNDSGNSSFTIIGAGISLPFQEDFESGIFPPAGWVSTDNYDLWSATNTAGGFGNSLNSARADFYHVISGSDEMTTPYLNLTNSIPPVKLKFTYAYAKKSLNKADTLKVAVSADCGETFTNVFVKGGTDLATAPDLTGAVFVPAINQWKDEFIDLTSYDASDKFLIRFQAISDHGNDLYLDDINVYGLSTGISELPENEQVYIYPNPSSGKFMIALTGNNFTDVTIEVFDLPGKKILELKDEKEAGMETYQLDMSASNGIYFVRVKTKDMSFTQPIVIGK